MPDPVSTSASAATAASAGISAVIVSIIGVGLQDVSLGVVGATLGVGFAPVAGWLHTIARFIASSVFAAVAGRAGAEWMSLTPMMSAFAICGSGIVLHLALSWLGRRFDSLADAGVARVGVNVGDKP